MKRYLTAVVFLLLGLPAGVYAQWYLFPGGRGSKDTVVVSRPAADTTLTLAPVFEEEETEEAVPVTRVALILPLKSTETPNSNFLDFYCGVLMAANELSRPEHKYEIHVFDSTVELPTMPQLDSSDLIIGPVNFDDVVSILPRTRGKYIISPLDPKVAQLTDRYNIIQAPAGWEAQVDELVRWLADDLRGGDTVVLLQSDGNSDGEITQRLAQKLGEEGIVYSISSTPASYEGTAKGSCRFVIASENDSFCSSAIREIALMNLKGGKNIVYSTSKLRSLSDLETESLHAAAARITASYYADAGAPAVRRFSESYRKIFKGDPGQWVFQGYDLLNYFGPLLEKEPDMWKEELAATPGKGLQTDFSFDASGQNNTAVRRLKYNANNTITIVK
ncbi:MAG: ABC transporter substrate-binding protein [Bacteroidales bacterium]|nr:ABC transporter substrate-binding protein [Bacteroidales bacterium]